MIEPTPKTILIVGGVAGGASCAARLRRLDEQAHITLIERGPYISFANCGLPYHIGGVIDDRDALLVQTPQGFKERFDVEVRTLTEVQAIDKEDKTITIQDLQSGQKTTLSYDKLVLSPGAAPFIPPIPGADSSFVRVLRNMGDMDSIIEACAGENLRHATVVGGGFIGLEIAENLIHRGIQVTLVELADQLMPAVDPELARSLEDACRSHGIDLRLSTRLTALDEENTRAIAVLDDQVRLATDLVIMAVGVRPESTLAADAELTLDTTGHILVDDQMRTSDPDIFAIGDVVKIRHRVSGQTLPIPLAGPANRQGRLVADIICGLDRRYAGALGTSIIKVFDRVAACTGISEKMAKELAIPHKVAWIWGQSHASYYPGAQSLMLKAIFDPQSGRLLGAQGVGDDGIDKRIDVLATAIAAELSVHDLEALDLCYAPPFSSAKDPVNHLGAVASGMIRGDHPTVRFDQWPTFSTESQIIDVRCPDECSEGSLPGAVNIPLNQLRAHLDSLDPDRPIITVCQEGLRGYLATRILIQRGFQAYNLLGGYRLWHLASDHQPLPA